MAQIAWTDPAIGDLEDIVEHISRDSFAYASREAKRIIDAVERLSQFPRIGRIVPEVGKDDIREVITGNYRTAYYLSDDRCFIIAIIHSSRDFLKVLSERIRV
ncbi:MAG: type II toxin-antitoxin system RelE/ParE family toxin [Ignavibacteriae bacterium]|nr:type II toxin-antitoxin system RelE/ParE family toxin [Ignavibacteriota bacterium]